MRKKRSNYRQHCWECEHNQSGMYDLPVCELLDCKFVTAGDPCPLLNVGDCPLPVSKIKPGDKVVMNDKYFVREKNKGRVFEVRSEVQMICGTECVFLEGYTGAYAADGLTKVTEE